MRYEVEGKFSVDVMVEVDADDEKSAELLAINVLNERYNLEVNGSYHNPKEDVKFDLTVYKPEDYK